MSAAPSLLWYGVARNARQRANTERLRVFLSGNIDVVSFDEEDAAAAGELCWYGSRRNANRPYVLLTATQTLRRRTTLVTANTSEFARMRGLDWKDWTAEAA